MHLWDSECQFLRPIAKNTEILKFGTQNYLHPILSHFCLAFIYEKKNAKYLRQGFLSGIHRELGLLHKCASYSNCTPCAFVLSLPQSCTISPPPPFSSLLSAFYPTCPVHPPSMVYHVSLALCPTDSPYRPSQGSAPPALTPNYAPTLALQEVGTAPNFICGSLAPEAQTGWKGCRQVQTVLIKLTNLGF